MRSALVQRLNTYIGPESWCFGGIVATRALGGASKDDGTIDIIIAPNKMEAAQDLVFVNHSATLRAVNSVWGRQTTILYCPDNVTVTGLYIAGRTKEVWLDEDRTKVASVANSQLTLEALLRGLAHKADEAHLVQLSSLYKHRLISQSDTARVLADLNSNGDFGLLKAIQNVSACEPTEARYIVLEVLSSYLAECAS